MMVALLTSSVVGHAAELHKGSRGELSLQIDSAYGAFRSDRAYAQTTVSAGSRTWTEGYADVALTGSMQAFGDSRWYGSVGVLGTGTWGDGDAAGFTTGREGRVALEDAFAGWRSGTLLPAFGENGIDVSVGRQNFMLGEGFLIDGDAVNFGKGFDDLAAAGIAPGSLDRGGAYWLGRRHAFDRIALAKLGAGTRVSGTLFWIESENEAQARTEIAGGDLVYTSDRWGKLALAYIHGLSVDRKWADFLGYTARDGQDTYNVRYDASKLHDALTLQGEYVYQDDDDGDDRAWYGEFAWQFSDLPWAPRAGVRYSSFSDGFDPLFYGFSTGYGTWFQGEVGGNYAGPFNTNADVTHLHLRGYPSERWTVGALLYRFETDDKRLGVDLDALELDLFFAWTINDHLTVSPLLGFYAPDRSADDGGVQLGDDDVNVYAQVVLLLNF